MQSFVGLLISITEAVHYCGSTVIGRQQALCFHARCGYGVWQALEYWGTGMGSVRGCANVA